MIKETKGKRELTSRDFFLASDAAEWEDVEGHWSFYMTFVSNVDEIFGTNVETTENNEFLNIYAMISPGFDCVEDQLVLVLYTDEGPDKELRYALSENEKSDILEMVLEHEIKHLRSLQNKNMEVKVA